MEKLLNYLSNCKRKFSPENINTLTQRMSKLDSDTEGTIEENILLMFSLGSGGMARLMGGESLGGTGRRWNGLTCSTANFRYNAGSVSLTYNQQEFKPGRIFCFELPKYTPREIKEISSEAYFRLAYDPIKRRSSIVEAFMGCPEKEAARVIAQTVASYNDLHGFNTELVPSKGSYLVAPGKEFKPANHPDIIMLLLHSN